MKRALIRSRAHLAVVAVLLLSLVSGLVGKETPAAYAATTTYQAESAMLSGGAAVATDHAGFTGSGFVGGYTDANKGAASTRFTISAVVGNNTVNLRYANGTGSAKTLSLYVNGTRLRQTSLPATANWDSWGTQAEAVTLNAGSNTIDYRFDTVDLGNVNVDNITVTDQAPPPPAGSGEAESAALAGGAVVATDHTGFTGTGFVGGYIDANRGLASTTFTVSAASAGDHSAALRYANGIGSARTLSLYVNGMKLRQISLLASANWDTWVTAAETVTLNAGSNTLSYRFDAADSGNVNLDALSVTKIATPPPPIEGSTISAPGGKCVEVAGEDTGGNNAPVQLWDCQPTAVDQHWTLTGGTLKTLARCLGTVANGTANGALISLLDCNGSTGQQWVPQADGTLKNPASGRCLDANGLTANGTRLRIFDCSASATQQFSSVGFPPVNPVGGATYEAEKAFVSGGAKTASGLAGASQSAYVDGFTSVGARVIFGVNSSAAASQSVELRYSNPSAARTLSVYVNGAKVQVVSLAGTGSASTWATAASTLGLRSGFNTITYQLDSGDTGVVNIDFFRLPNGPVMAARGATLPYEEFEAENGSTNAATIGPDRTYLTQASEASARKAVKLTSNGQYVQFTLAKAANSIVIRYSVPDSVNGADTTPSLGLYTNGTRIKSVPMTTRYSWVYGSYPYNNNPANGAGHHFFDEVRVLTAGMPAGTVVKLQKDVPDTAANYVIDLVDFEQVDTAFPMPAGLLSAASFGAVADDGADDTAALNSAIAGAKSQGKSLWIPAGRFDINARINVDHVTIRGAGPWYSILHGLSGKGGLFATGDQVGLFDLAIDGDATYRDDGAFDTAIEGNFGAGSMVQNVWMEHAKVGMWIDSGTNGLSVSGVRIRDTWADGVNIHSNVRNAQVVQSSIRNTGDDGLAMFSESAPVTESAFLFNSVQLPMLANSIGIYGGSGNRAEDNVLSDTVTGSAGLAISTRFGIPFSGTTTAARNTLIRTGGLEQNWNTKFGAIWVYADPARSDITTPVVISDNEVLDSTYSGLLISFNRTVTNLTLDRNRIDGAGTFGIEIQSAGWANFSNVTVANAAAGGLSVSGGFDVRRGPGNSGF